MSGNTKQERMRKIYEEARDCRNCPLCEGARNVVVGEGSLEATVVFIGEAPGQKEDETGRPFVGSAGRFLNSLLSKIGLKREDVYISNVVKCRPPNNRRPTQREIEECTPLLEEQLDIIRPRVIVPMGNSAIAYFWSRFGLNPATIGEVHGREFEVDAPWGRIILFPTYHPAAALYTQWLEKTMNKDFEDLAALLKRIGGPRTGGP